MAGESGRLTRLGTASGGGGSIDQVDVDTSGAVITLDFAGNSQRIFTGVPAIAGNKSVALANDTNALVLYFSFELDAAGRSLQFPAGFRSSDALWDRATRTWTSLDAGAFQAEATFDGTNWNMVFLGVYN